MNEQEKRMLLAAIQDSVNTGVDSYPINSRTAKAWIEVTDQANQMLSVIRRIAYASKKRTK